MGSPPFLYTLESNGRVPPAFHERVAVFVERVVSRAESAGIESVHVRYLVVRKVDAPHELVTLACEPLSKGHEMSVGAIGVFTFSLCQRHHSVFSMPIECSGLVGEIAHLVDVAQVKTLVVTMFDPPEVVLCSFVAPFVPCLIKVLGETDDAGFTCVLVRESNGTRPLARGRHRNIFLRESKMFVMGVHTRLAEFALVERHGKVAPRTEVGETGIRAEPASALHEDGVVVGRVLGLARKAERHGLSCIYLYMVNSFQFFRSHERR